MLSLSIFLGIPMGVLLNMFNANLSFKSYRWRSDSCVTFPPTTIHASFSRKATIYISQSSKVRQVSQQKVKKGGRNGQVPRPIDRN